MANKKQAEPTTYTVTEPYVNEDILDPRFAEIMSSSTASGEAQGQTPVIDEETEKETEKENMEIRPASEEVLKIEIPEAVTHIIESNPYAQEISIQITVTREDGVPTANIHSLIKERIL